MQFVFPSAVDKNIAPMKKLMDFVWRGGLRLSDLFRSFDKNANLSISNEEFIRRIKVSDTSFSFSSSRVSPSFLGRSLWEVGLRFFPVF